MATKKATPRTTSPKSPSPAILRYAVSSARTTLGDDDATVEEAKDSVRFACRGIPYATLRVVGSELVVTLLAPKSPGDLAPQLQHYKGARDTGWLEWRTPVSRDPRPWLEARVGSMVGQTLYEILHRKRSR